jgi:DNA-binding LacI/PurR family transcriptional regulator
VDHLHALGHRSLVYLAGPRASYANLERRAALQVACGGQQMPLTELGPFEPSFEAGVRAADLVLAGDDSAVVAYNDQIALGLMSRISERGFRVGRDISVVGIDDSWIARMSSPSLTTVRVPAASAGAAAVRLLVGLAVSGSDVPPRDRLETELVVRASTGPPVRTDTGQALPAS